MCGIVGLMGSFSKNDGFTRVKRMNKAIAHRGPDDENLWAQDGFAFGMHRLSIIDIAGGRQPIWTNDGVGIIYNGEIYNYKKLRRELEDAGCVFATKSDTEVILNLYHTYGIEAINRLEGMFGICLFDPRQSTVNLVRDRLGIKPLYYGIKDKQFYFASEIKSILEGMGSKPAINRQSIHHYLTLRYIPSPETVWNGIYKLEPGHRLTYNLKSHAWSIMQYWELACESAPIDPSRDYVGEFERLFLDAVETHLVTSDVPVGVMLSGGLDSSAVSAAAVEMKHRNFHTFSVGFDIGGEFSELSYARKMAQYINSQHHEVVIDQKAFIDGIPALVRFSDEPLADLASIPLYYVSRLAQKHVKVVLTGEGSDEIFAGYDIEQLAARVALLKKTVDMLPAWAIKALSCMPGKKGDIFKLLSAHGWSNYLKEKKAHMTHYWSEQEKQSLWQDEQKNDSTDSLIKGWYEKSNTAHPIDQLQWVYCHSWLVEDLLMKADKMSMAHSLELRVPFLTHPLVEWGLSLPMVWKVGDKKNGYVSKRILREFAKKRLPESIITRPKQGFPVPAYEWLKGSLGDWAEECIMSKGNFLDSMFDMSLVKPVLTNARQGDRLSAHKIWLLIILEHWGRQWML